MIALRRYIFSNLLVLFYACLKMTFGQQNTETEAHEQLSYAYEHGINIIDTAEAVSFLINLLFPIKFII